MEVIRDFDGNVIQRSRNLAGIRRYVGRHLIKQLDISPIGAWEGRLCILFENGCSFETNFASYSVLVGFVRRWKNVHGAPLSINGSPSGVVSSKNPSL